MILMRETTPETMRLGTRAASWSTPSMRNRIRISPSSASKWMSEAPSVTAWPRMLLTSLITGASSAWARMSVTSASSSSASSSIASATVLSIVPSFPIRASMSAAGATATWQLRPVAICTSSMARTLAGSAIASRSVPSLTYPTGTAWCRRADFSEIRLVAPMSTW